MIIKRFPTKEIFLGKVGIGGTNPISIQSMTTTTTSDIKATLAQIEALRQNGADIVRVAVLSKTDSEALEDLVKESPIPLVADIHFNAAFALKALKARIPGLRLNPGNIKDPKDVKEIINAAKEYNPAIRIGVNGGSLDKNLYPEDSAQNIVKSALEHIKILEKEGFTNIKVSLKSTDVLKTVEAYELFTKERDYPLHLGITEAGDAFTSSIRSSIGMGHLLIKGIGDTLRVSVSGDPLIEPLIAKEILLSLGLTKGVKLIGCPTCGRKNLDVEKIILLLREELKPLNIQKNISIAIMGCIVNGLGEASHTDIGVVGIGEHCEIYSGGKKIATLPSHNEKEIATKVLQILKHFLE